MGGGPLFESVRTVLLASDPGWQRLRSAARAALTVAGAYFTADGVARLTGQAMTIALLGAVVGMLTAVSVNDSTQRGRATTMALIPVAAAPVMALAALLSPYQWAADVVFVVVMASAAYVRRFGPRMTALGMVGYMAYFFSLFLEAKPSQVPWLVVSAFTGVAVAAVIRFGIIRDSTAHSGEQGRRMLLGRVARLLDAIADELAAGRGRHRRRQLRRRAAEVNEACLILENQLQGGDAGPDGEQPDPARDRARAWVLEVELAAEHLSEVSWQNTSSGPPGSAQAAGLVREAARSLRHGDETASVLAGRDRTAGRVQAAMGNLADALDDAPSPFPPLAAPGRRPGLLSPGSTTGPALQVAVAGSLAIAAGSFVSPTRWFWAVITAFTVFSNTTTSAATILRALQRVVGTAAGIVAGLVIAAALAGHTLGELGLLFVCVFVAFYYVQTAYQVMVFFITVMVSLLYSLLGEFSFSLLSLRLEETAIGAVIGGVVAFAVLPQRSREPISAAVADALNELADLLENLSPPAAPGTLLDQSRGLDQTAQQLRTLAGPVAIWPGTRARRTRGVSAAVGALAYCARAIAASPQAYADCAATPVVAGQARDVARRFAGETRQRHDDCAGDSVLPALPPRLQVVERMISYLDSVTPSG